MQVEELQSLELSLDAALAVLGMSVAAVQHPRLAPHQLEPVVPQTNLNHKYS